MAGLLDVDMACLTKYTDKDGPGLSLALSNAADELVW